MTVIAFRPRPGSGPGRPVEPPVELVGTLRSPRGRVGRMEGSLRVRRLVILACGTFVSGVVTGRLYDADGSLVGLGTRRATLAADLVRDGDGYLPVLKAFDIDLMGLPVHVPATPMGLAHAPGRRPHPG